MGLRSLHTSIFIKTPSLEGLPTKAKEIPLPMRWDYLLPDINPVFPGLWDILYYYYCYYYYYYYFIIIIIMFFEMEYYSLKEKVITILNNSVSQFSIESKKIPPPPCGAYFFKNWQFMIMKASSRWKTFRWSPWLTRTNQKLWYPLF